MAALLTDFLDAHERHLDDADHLRGVSRYANADHLYGVSAECGMKRLMIVFGMPTTGGDVGHYKDREHANKHWARYDAYRAGHALAAGYALPTANPFRDWSMSQRYASRTHFSDRVVAPHAAAAHQVSALVTQAKRDGLL